MLQNIRTRNFATLFSDGVEAEAPMSQAERKRRRAELLRESAGRTFVRFCADINHALKPRALAGLPGTLDFLVREKSIGAASLPDARHSRQVPDGLAGLAPDLSPEAILDAYSRGLFLRWMLGQATLWAPHSRMLMEPDAAREPDELAVRLAAGEYRITLDRDFDAVIHAATSDAINQRTPYAPSARGMNVFAALHDAGFAHSVEVRTKDGALVGGLYGIACGGMFVIQSRFGLDGFASDIAVLALIRHLKVWDFKLIDGCADKGLDNLGFEEVTRQAQLARIPGALVGGRPGRWLASPQLLGQPVRDITAI